MKHVQHLVAALITVAAATAAQAQYVKGNEAVIEGPTGKKVEKPQIPATARAAKASPCRADENCHSGHWSMVETDAGIQECTEPFARAGTCRASTYGAKRLYRVWVVKHNGNWMQCQLPDLNSKCVELFGRPPNNLPHPALQ